MRVTILDSHEPPLSPDRLTAVERELGFELPPAYCQFLLAYNGGRPEKDRFSLPDGHSDIVNWFLGVHDGDEDHLLRYREVYGERVPRELLPIAHDPGGNLICLGIGGPRRDQIFFWDHNCESEEGQPASFDNVTLLAPDLERFLASLT